VAAFLCKQDLPEISPAHLSTCCGLERADLLILIGSSLLQTAAAAAKAWRSGGTNALLISGGIGHSTEDLRRNVRADRRFSGIKVDESSEAKILADVMKSGYGLDGDAILLETRSTNCGANAEESRHVLVDCGMEPSSIIIVQDPLMQRRTVASFERVWQDQPVVRFISAPPFVPLLDVRGGHLAFAHPPEEKLWDLPRYLSLLMGEIPRIRDDASGYGPRGKGYIAHVDIPYEVEAAYDRLLPRFAPYARPVV
jgi:uncharacterized SAM-binding protein YcdF (DUF218 family)